MILFIALILALGLLLFWAVTHFRRRGELPGSISPEPRFESNYVQVGEFKIHYTKAGTSGPYIVLLHGIGASQFIWRFLMQMCAAHFQVIAVDLPGFGESSKIRDADYGLDAQAERMNQFLDQLHVTKAYLVGSSMGGAIALWMARTYPQRFSKVVALAPATHPRATFLDLSLFRHVAIGALINKSLMRQMLLRVVSRAELVTDDVVERYLKPYTDNSGLQTFLLATRILQDPRLPQALNDVKAPVLLLYGEQDKLITHKMMTDLARILPNARLVTHPTAGHHSMEDEPDWVMGQINYFFQA